MSESYLTFIEYVREVQAFQGRTHIFLKNYCPNLPVSDEVKRELEDLFEIYLPLAVKKLENPDQAFSNGRMQFSFLKAHEHTQGMWSRWKSIMQQFNREVEEIASLAKSLPPLQAGEDIAGELDTLISTSQDNIFSGIR